MKKGSNLSVKYLLRHLWVFMFLNLCIACSKELPSLVATSSNQLTAELILDARLSTDSDKAFILTKGPIFTVWDIASGLSEQTIGAEYLAADTRLFALSKTEKSLLTSDGQSLRLWDMKNLQLSGTLDFVQQLGDAYITSMAFINDSILVTGNSDGSMIFADLGNNVFRRSHFHSNEVVDLIVGHEKNYLYSAGNDGKVVVTDLHIFDIKNQFDAPFRITGLVSNQDNSLLFISDALDKQSIWQPHNNRVLRELDYWQQYRFFRLGLFWDNDKQLITTSPKTEISLWDIESGKERGKWQATSHSLGSTILDLRQRNDSTVVTLTSDAVVETWELHSL